MEVTKENFDQVLPVIAEAIKECDFLAFDTELTGLTTRGQRITGLDSVEERYQKIRASATSFQTIQWGLCAFKWDEQSRTFLARPFNIFVFPTPFNRSFEPTFLSQVSSLHFLAAHKFDFNKLIYSGITHLRRDEEQRLRQQFAPNSRDEVILSPDDQKFMAGVFERIDHWLQNSTDKELALDPCNPYLRRVSYQEIEKKYNNRLHAQTKEGERYQRYLVISRMTEEEKRQKEEEKRTVSEEELNQAIGFRKVLDLISESRKPLVGHNMMLDVVHTFGFLWYPPDNCHEFKDRLHALFPVLVDTKLVASASRVIGGLLPGTSLDEAYATVLKDPFVGPQIEFAAGFEEYTESPESFHEAGFDAYATGVVYLRLAHYIASKSSTPNANLLPDGELMQSYANKIFMMRSDIQFINLTGPEDQPTRQNVFWVHGFSPQTSTRDILHHFQPLGKIDIKWIDDTSLLATVQDPDKVIPHFAAVRPPFHVADYETYVASTASRMSRETPPQRRPFTPSPPRRGMKRPYEDKDKPAEEEKATAEEPPKEEPSSPQPTEEPEAKKQKTGDSLCIIC